MTERNDGKDFEEAVHSIVKALGPTATVKFDYKVPDRDTGTGRQCDVWIEAKLIGHYPIKYLVSCKDKSRKLSIDDIGAFKSQIDSVGASSGAIYSRKGFYKPAIEKARALGIACCRLYANQPADMPEVIICRAYAATPGLSLGLEKIGQLGAIKTYDELFALEVPNKSNGRFSMIEFLEEEFLEAERDALGACRKAGKLFPDDFSSAFHMQPTEAIVRITCKWNRYRAPVNAHLISGSYSVTDGHFVGQQASPAFDTWDPPGKWWEKITEGEEVTPGESNMALIILGPYIKKALLHAFGGKLLPDAVL